MGVAERAEKMSIRKGYKNVWRTSLMEAIQSDPAFCLLSSVCSQCVSFGLRREALHNEMSRYVCCAGYMPCSGKCQEDKCPTLCLCMEVFFCLSNSVASTRFLLQDEYNIQTTECDNCLVAFMIILGQVACICRLLACLSGNDDLQDLAEILTCVSDLVYCTVCACMQTQHKVEMDYRHGIPGGGVMMVPPAQQMSRFDRPMPPNVTQQPPHAQQYPPGPYPPQQGQWQQPPPAYGYGYPPGPQPYMQGYPTNASPPPGSYGGYQQPPPGYHPGGQGGQMYPGYHPPAGVPPQQHPPSAEHPGNPPHPQHAPKDSA